MVPPYSRFRLSMPRDQRQEGRPTQRPLPASPGGRAGCRRAISSAHHAPSSRRRLSSPPVARLAELPEPLLERSDQRVRSSPDWSRRETRSRDPGCRLSIARGAGRGNGEQEHEAEERSRAHEMPGCEVMGSSAVPPSRTRQLKRVLGASAPHGRGPSPYPFDRTCRWPGRDAPSPVESRPRP